MIPMPAPMVSHDQKVTLFLISTILDLTATRVLLMMITTSCDADASASSVT